MAEPMIKLDPSGTAPVLDYKLPDSTSYAGRHYVVLDFPGEPFAPVLTTGGRAPDPGSRDNLPLLDLVLHGPELTGIDARDDGTLSFRSSIPLDPSLTALTRESLTKMKDSGFAPVIMRSMSGSLTLYMAPSGTPQDDMTTGGIPTDEPKPMVHIASPTEGAVITGPAGGTEVAVSGSASVVIGYGDVSYVEARVDNGQWTRATKQGASWVGWTAQLRLATAGPHRIQARAVLMRKKGDITWTDSRRVVADLSLPALGDTIAPTLHVVTPADNALIVESTGTARVPFAGEATDDTGVSKVEVSVDGGPPVSATPQAPNDYGHWTAEIELTTAGHHACTVTAADAAGNIHAETVKLQVSLNDRGRLLRSYLTLVESYRLSNFLGRYGAGRPIKTFSLLPGEETKISVKTWTQTEETRREATSILESNESKAATDFAQTLEAENTAKQSSSDRFEWEVNSKVEQGWGTGKASVDGGLAGGTNAEREEFGKTVMNVTSKHAAEASSKRDVQVDAEYERAVKTGLETTIERQIRNVNISRTLNFVFRQMNLEFVSLLHLVDVRVAFVRVYERGKPDYRECRISEFRSLVDQVVLPQRRVEVYEHVRGLLRQVADYQDTLHDITEEVVPKMDGTNPQRVPDAGYIRIRRNLQQTYVPDGGSRRDAITVPGVILAATTNVMRTEGVIVDAVLGQGEALDSFTSATQGSTIRERDLRNGLLNEEIAERRQARRIIRANKKDQADIYEKVRSVPNGQPLRLSLSAVHDDGETPTP